MRRPPTDAGSDRDESTPGDEEWDRRHAATRRESRPRGRIVTDSLADDPRRKFEDANGESDDDDAPAADDGGGESNDGNGPDPLEYYSRHSRCPAS